MLTHILEDGFFPEDDIKQELNNLPAYFHQRNHGETYGTGEIRKVKNWILCWNNLNKISKRENILI